MKAYRASAKDGSAVTDATPRFKVAAIVANNAPTEYGVFDMADRRTFNGKLRHKYATV